MFVAFKYIELISKIYSHELFENIETIVSRLIKYDCSLTNGYYQAEKRGYNIMSDTVKGSIIGAIIGAIITGLVSLLIFFLGNFSTQSTIVKTLSEYFDSVTNEMSYTEALQTIYKASNQKDQDISVLEQQNNDLEEQLQSIPADVVKVLSEHFKSVDKDMSYTQALLKACEESKNMDSEIETLKKQNSEYENHISGIPSVEFKNPMLISDGLKIQDSINKSIVVVDNNIYYSEGIIDFVLKDAFSYDATQNTVYYNTAGTNISAETKIDLFDTNALYDGNCYGVFLPSDGKTFSMGSGAYNKGFVIWDDHSLFGPGDGYALFDLQGNYSKISFDVGRTNEYEKQDVVLKVYLNNEYVEEYSLNAQSPPVKLEIDLRYANNLKLEITGGSRVKYGFANVILHY